MLVIAGFMQTLAVLVFHVSNPWVNLAISVASALIFSGYIMYGI